MQIDAYNPEKDREEVAEISRVLAKDLSEPYSHYVYQYFLTSWPKLAFLARQDDKVVGVIVASIRPHKNRKRGYIAMLAVDGPFRGQGLAKKLIETALEAMIADGSDEVTLETETSNAAALGLYQQFGFIRSRRMHRYYLNGNDAFRLSLPLTAAATKSTIYPS